jgi:dihydroorotate dehydrogenase
MFNPLLFLPPETAHKIALMACKFGLIPHTQKPETLTKEILGLKFPSPLGLSAGADKEGYALNGWGRIGFGFVETGTVTLSPRNGNPMPRVWRQKKQNSVINWMGLPGKGYHPFINNLKRYREAHQKNDLIVGVSIASPESILSDFEKLARECAPYTDYFTLNASCPNVSDHGDALQNIADQIKSTVQHANDKPVLLKLGPTKEKDALIKTLDIATAAGAIGFVFTNTVPPTSTNLINEDGFNWPTHDGERVGGYSGPQLLEITEFMIKTARDHLGEDVPLIGVGGIQSGDDAQRIIDAGADLIQIYTGFIYKGPKLVKEINQTLA